MGLYYLSVGRTDDPDLHWERGDYTGNIPTPMAKIPVGLLGCVKARQLLESPKYGGRVLDWGASGAMMHKGQIVQFLEGTGTV
jgi:hypothetical protein